MMLCVYAGTVEVAADKAQVTNNHLSSLLRETDGRCEKENEM
jgi:hypothetical protein